MIPKAIARKILTATYIVAWRPRGFWAALAARQTAYIRIYVDVSMLYKHDSGTGIQRVVRAFLLQLLKIPNDGYQVIPVVGSRKSAYRHVKSDFTFAEYLHDMQFDVPMIPRKGDLFFGLDLSAHILPYHFWEIIWWRACGLRLAVMIYDVLPAQHPQFFTARGVRHFQRWLSFVARHVDLALCISRSVMLDIDDVLTGKGAKQGHLRIEHVALGGDLMNSAPSAGISDVESDWLASLGSDPLILMVGTVEPRKGYGIALDAFERIWTDPSRRVRLIIVGRKGWRSEEFENRLERHPEKQQRLFRLDNASDELLDRLYRCCSGLLMTSHAEGFGLPLLEARSYGMPVLARDLPIFREVGDDGVDFFSDDRDLALAASIMNWLDAPSGRGRNGYNLHASWDDAGRRLVTQLRAFMQKS